MAYKSEQEVIIRFDNESDTATIYTANPTWINKMRKIAAENKEFRLLEEGKIKDTVISETYTFPKKLITIRSKQVKRVLTDEQKAELAERAKRMQEARKNK